MQEKIKRLAFDWHPLLSFCMLPNSVCFIPGCTALDVGGAQVSLIVGLLVGTVGMGAFVGVQIAQEGRSAVRVVTEALPTWSADAYDSANASLSTALVKQVV